MGLLSKVKRALSIGLISLVGISNGCITSHEYSLEKGETKVNYEHNDSQFKKTTTHLEILNDKKYVVEEKDGFVFTVPIDKVETIAIYKGERAITETECEEIFRTEKDRWKIPIYIVPPLVIGTLMNSVVTENKDRVFFGGALGSVLIFSLPLDFGTRNISNRFDRKTNKKSRLKKETGEWIIGEFFESKQQVQNASNLPVKVSSTYLKPGASVISTDNLGHAAVKIPLTAYDFFAQDRASLENRIRDSDLVDMIKPPVRSSLIEEMLNNSSQKTIDLILETLYKTDNKEEKVENDKKKFAFDFYGLDQETIHSILRNFIDREVNSKIGDVVLRIKDRDTHLPVKEAQVDIHTRAPSPRELLANYFTGKLLNWGESKVLSYEDKDAQAKTDYEGIAKFRLYKQRGAQIEITHPGYFFENLNIVFNEEFSFQKEVELRETGKKTRVEMINP